MVGEAVPAGRAAPPAGRRSARARPAQTARRLDASRALPRRTGPPELDVDACRSSPARTGARHLRPQAAARAPPHLREGDGARLLRQHDRDAGGRVAREALPQDRVDLVGAAVGGQRRGVRRGQLDPRKGSRAETIAITTTTCDRARMAQHEVAPRPCQRRSLDAPGAAAAPARSRAGRASPAAPAAPSGRPAPRSARPPRRPRRSSRGSAGGTRTGRRARPRP